MIRRAAALGLLAGCGGGLSWSARDLTRLQRLTEPGSFAVPPHAVDGCGTATITGELGSGGTEIHLRWARADPQPEDCCPSYVWIQHVLDGGTWRFDNGALGNSRRGAESDPTADPQPVGNGPPWDPNPWYGGPGSGTRTTVPRDWDRHPSPQFEIDDAPTGAPLGFVDQLVCLQTGAVAYEYRWVQVNDAAGHPTFVGAEDGDLTITP